MSNYKLITPEQMAQKIAQRLQYLRVQNNWTQKTLAQRAGVSLGSLRRFEQTGEISFGSLLLLATALDHLDDFENILHPPPAQSLAELEEQDRSTSKKRGRI